MNIETPSQRLEKYLKSQAIEFNDFCRSAGIKTGNADKYVGESNGIKKKSTFKSNKRDNFEQAGLNYDWYLTGQGEMLLSDELAKPMQITTDIQEVSVDPKTTEQLLSMPVYDLPVHANVGVGHNFEDLPMSYKPMNFGMKLDPLTAKVFRVSGDSMRDARIFNGAYIVIDTKLQPTNHSEILANHNGVLIVKHYEQAETGFKLYSQNGGKHEYQIADTDYLDIIGVVRLVFNYR